jgi:hypothetical protein
MKTNFQRKAAKTPSTTGKDIFEFPFNYLSLRFGVLAFDLSLEVRHG